MNMGSELIKAEPKTNVAVVISDGGPRLTRQRPSAQIGSLKGAMLAGGLAPCSFAAST